MFPSALEGTRVLDLTNNVAGPFASMILADLGAEVIKVERPVLGDDTRRWGPPFWNDESPSFLALNRNKRSVALDLKSSGGMEVLHRLVSTSDVLLENFTVRAVNRLGLDFESVCGIRPDIVYCEMGGYGGTGPVSEQPAYDAMMQAYSGVMSLAGEDGRVPVRVPVSVLDQGTGMWAANAILAALLMRSRTGRGAKLQTSLLHTALMWMPAQIGGFHGSGRLPERHGSGLSSVVPYQAFAASDGHIVVAAGNDRLFGLLCDALGHPEWGHDKRFATNPDRVHHRDVLLSLLAGELERSTVADWTVRLEAAGVPVAPVRTIDQVLEDPHVVSTGFVAEGEHPRIPGYRYVTLPVSVDGERSPLRLPPPRIGEDTRAVLDELEYSNEDIATLAKVGAIGLGEEGDGG
ncbi:MAG: hypothetical protein ABS81_04085 [Pseudonocardia sp. SCN 72-86]|nr:MAG: hypothetical protein ABS81_04085 [Pseudonocardia sp. SCN 72-86]